MRYNDFPSYEHVAWGILEDRRVKKFFYKEVKEERGLFAGLFRNESWLVFTVIRFMSAIQGILGRKPLFKN